MCATRLPERLGSASGDEGAWGRGVWPGVDGHSSPWICHRRVQVRHYPHSGAARVTLGNFGERHQHRRPTCQKGECKWRLAQRRLDAADPLPPPDDPPLMASGERCAPATLPGVLGPAAYHSESATSAMTPSVAGLTTVIVPPLTAGCHRPAMNRPCGTRSAAPARTPGASAVTVALVVAAKSCCHPFRVR
jgi:hypothetical protein